MHINAYRNTSFLSHTEHSRRVLEIFMGKQLLLIVITPWRTYIHYVDKMPKYQC